MRAVVRRIAAALVALIAVAPSPSSADAPLPDRCIARLVSESLQPPGRDRPLPLESVREVAWSPDGRLLAIRSEPGNAAAARTIHVWDAAASRPALAVEWDSSPLTGLAFFGDGSRLVASVADAPNGVQLWNIPAGRPVRSFASGRGRAIVAGEWELVGVLAPAGKSEILRLHRPDTGEEARRFVLPDSYAAEFSPDGTRVVVVPRFGESQLRVVDVVSGKELRRLTGLNRSPAVMRFSADGRTVAAGTSDRGIVVWEVATGGIVFRDDAASKGVLSIAFSGDDLHVSAGGIDRTVRTWELATGSAGRSFAGHIGAVSTVAFSPDSRMLASGSFDRTVMLWDFTVGMKSSLPSDRPDDAALARLWDDLGASSAGAAYAAIGRIRLSSADVLPWLSTRVRTQLLPPERERIDALVRDLGDRDSLVRHRATDELRKLRELARPLLTRLAKESPSAEVRARARRIVQLAEVAPRYNDSDFRRLARVVHALSTVPGPQSAATLEVIAKELPHPEISRDATATLRRMRK